MLTIGVMTPPAKASGIVTPGGNAPPKKETEFEAVPCMGQSCAWFMNIVDEKGRITDGQCAIPLACASAGQLVTVGAVLLQSAAQPQPPNGAPDAPPPPVIPNKP